MTITAKEILENVRFQVRQPEEEGSSWDNPEIIRVINFVAPEVYSNLGVGKFSREIVGNGSAKYPLPAGCNSVERVMDHGSPLPYVTPKLAGILSDENGTAIGGYGYTVIGDYIWILPSLIDTGSVEIFYKGTPPKLLNKDDYMSVPQNTMQPLVYRVASELLRTIDNAKSNDLYGMYTVSAQRVKGEEVDKQSPSVGSVGIPARRR